MKQLTQLIFFACLLMVQLSFGQIDGPTSPFTTANNAYNKGEYKTAIEQYQKLIDWEYHSAELFYNLGNAYYKNEENSKAILYYEKAIKYGELEDVVYNLNLANAKIEDKIEPLPQFFLAAMTDKISSPTVWAITSILLVWLGFLSLYFFFTGKTTSIKKRRFFSAMFVFLLAGMTFFLTYQAHQNTYNNTQAIIMAEELSVKSAPNENSAELFIIHEGLKVNITQEKEDWIEIKLSNGEKGWVNYNSILKI